ncbi:hypothetical protein AB0305_21475, partial [Arthrobacter sp. NPDC080086]
FLQNHDQVGNRAFGDRLTSAEVRAPGRVERVLEHVKATAERNDIDTDIVGETYKAMIDAFIRLELEVYKAGS